MMKFTNRSTYHLFYCLGLKDVLFFIIVGFFQKGDLICQVNGKPFQNILHRDAVDFLLNCDTNLAISYQVN